MNSPSDDLRAGSPVGAKPTNSPKCGCRGYLSQRCAVHEALFVAGRTEEGNAILARLVASAVVAGMRAADESTVGEVCAAVCDKWGI